MRYFKCKRWAMVEELWGGGGHGTHMATCHRQSRITSLKRKKKKFPLKVGGIVVGHGRHRSMGMGIHAYGGYACARRARDGHMDAWVYGCMRLGSSTILIHGPRWHLSNVVGITWCYNVQLWCSFCSMIIL